MAIDIESPGLSEAALTAALVALVFNREQLTTGGSPVAASADKSITEIVSGGTNGVEMVTLAVPASPELKVGKVKTFLFKTQAGSEHVRINPATFVSPGGSADASDLYDLSVPGDIFQCRLVYAPNLAVPGYAWQAVSMVQQGASYNFVSRLNGSSGIRGSSLYVTLGNSSGDDEEDGGGLSIQCGESASGNGGNFEATTGSGAVDGGDFKINLAVEGSGRTGLLRFTGAQPPTSDPGIEGAVYSAAGVLKISAG